MRFIIEKNIPIPETRGGYNGHKYPFSSMEPGDSFVVKAEDLADGKTGVDRVRRAAASYGKYHKIKFATRLQEDGSVRVWRLR